MLLILLICDIRREIEGAIPTLYKLHCIKILPVQRAANAYYSGEII